MARTIEQIQQQIVDSVQADPTLSEASSPSRRAHWNLWANEVAAASNNLEQVWDEKLIELETAAAQNPAATIPWIQARMFEFQYDANTPQVLQLFTNTTKPYYYYPTVDTSKCIITQCSPYKSFNNVMLIKVAKGNVPGPLDASELSAAQDYVDTLFPAPIYYIVQSSAADKLYLSADIYYRGQYSAVIQTNVINALNAYLLLLAKTDFNGKLGLTDLEIVIRAVAGVTDVVLKNVGARADSTLFANKTMLVLNNTELAKDWQTKAGYIVQETTSGSTFADTLNFIAQ